MSSRSKSTLFLIEQLIVIAVFAICATACVRILTNAYFYAVDSRDVSNALIVAQSAADTFKATEGSAGKTATLLGVGRLVEFAENFDGTFDLVVRYNEKWQVCEIDDARYILHLAGGPSGGSTSRLLSGELSVSKVGGGELVSFPVAVNVSG